MFFSENGRMRDNVLYEKAYATTDLKPNECDNVSAGTWALLNKKYTVH